MRRLKALSSSIVALCLMLIGLYILTFILAALFGQPSFDDFCYAANPQGDGFWERQISIYRSWSSRFTSTFFLTLIPRALNYPRYYGVFTAAFLAAFLTFYILLYKELVSKTFGSVLLPLVAFSVFTQLQTSPTQAFFWHAGVVNYLNGLTLMAVIAYAMMKMKSEVTLPQKVVFFLAGVVLAGVHELFVPLAILLLGLTWSLTRRHSEKYPARMLLFVITGLLTGTLFLIYSPGDASRVQISQFEGTRNLSVSLLYGAKFVVNEIALTFGTPHFLIFAALILSIVKWERQAWIRFTAIFGLFIAIGYTAGFTLNYFYGDIEVPDRVRVLTQSYVLIIPFAVGSIAPERMKSLQVTCLVVVLVALLLTSDLYRGLISDLRHGRSFWSELQHRYTYVKEARKEGQSVLTLKPLSYSPRVIFLSDISDDQSHLKNICFARYFNLHFVQKDK